MKTAAITLAGALMTGMMLSPTHAVPAKKKPAPKPTVGTRGTHQMAGGEGVFGQTYTLKDGPNFTLTSAEYSVARVNLSAGGALVPKADEKLLVLHFRAKNPRKDDLYLGGTFIGFQTVAADGKTRDDSQYIIHTGDKDSLAVTLKPGQGVDDLMTAYVVPAAGPVPKLILNKGREGTSEEVTRYSLGTAQNPIKPLAAPFADPADPKGATALANVPAVIGQTYPAGYFDITLDSLAFSSDKIGDNDPPDGKRWLVGVMTVKNQSHEHVYISAANAFKIFLKDSDGDKTVFDGYLRHVKNDDNTDDSPEFGETVRTRFYLPVPKDGAPGATLSIAENVDNSGGVSRAYVYDISGLK
ncbi:hypothetical protein CCAX7_006870 [Capsulimonas corticalis]|uniref:Uncharacterized protein n=1 Tax=Capsulimonas corticalis TaxID=2219043 RepID=A0A402D1M9_9BACT|nr:hypothetical protein [Capsulimonas corticalis]BDI28636.1 hypothetical protein CCAX7_006870 [Capsulimonas corticalis]